MDRELCQSAILGIIQGLTEFFPVSSTAHLILVPWAFGWKGEVDTLSFDIALHAGTLLALLIFFMKDWIHIFTRETRLLLLICIATIPAGVAGFLLQDVVEHSLRSPLVISLSLVGIGFFMLYTERVGRKRHDLDTISLLDVILIGISQAFALVPGVSRSGITISTGMLRGLKREASARFSFLMATPVIGGATLLEGKSFIEHYESHDMTLLLIGIATSFISGLCAIHFLLRFFRRFPLTLFVYYRFVLSGIIMVMLWMVN